MNCENQQINVPDTETNVYGKIALNEHLYICYEPSAELMPPAVYLKKKKFEQNTDKFTFVDFFFLLMFWKHNIQ